MVRAVGASLVVAAAATLVVGIACRDSTSVRPNYVVTTPGVRITGLGQIGPDSLTAHWDVQTFNFDVRSDLTGTMVFNHTGVLTEPSSYTLLVDHVADPVTGFTAFTASSSVCADPSRGVEFDGVSREIADATGPLNSGSLVSFHVAACDNGPSGSGLDIFSFTVPTAGYQRSGYLTAGDIAKSTF